MAKFSELGIEHNAIIGPGISIDKLLNKRIVIEKVRISTSLYPGKNKSGMRMQMQIVFATFNDKPDADGDFYVKDANGNPLGERYSCFTGSEVLMQTIKQAEESVPKDKLYPMDTTIVRSGKCFIFT